MYTNFVRPVQETLAPPRSDLAEAAPTAAPAVAAQTPVASAIASAPAVENDPAPPDDSESPALHDFKEGPHCSRSQHDELNKRLTAQGLTRVKNAGKGHCFFRCLQAIEDSVFFKQSVKQIRAQIATELLVMYEHRKVKYTIYILYTYLCMYGSCLICIAALTLCVSTGHLRFELRLPSAWL
jgi:hypothetical protein